ncbi:YlbD family protein [Bacillus sp. FJAT-49732]|uniref:YlbD family protein n=1 Tax=Lederbergia citrisecunda TaxID=2833583 RepID=A0A942TMB8_9BACI|nr:YlbD family protein [Lederbergia citrisecunda]MBS4198834.1 YlbD family protein [Lederbergia citrisecunda]
MASKSLHPSVEQFKSFVKEHPKLLQSVRKKENTWQELYEDWFLLGADDPKWAQFEDNNTEQAVSNNEPEPEQKNWMNQITGIIKNMDANQVQHHINQLSQAIGAIQGVINQFQTNNPPTINQPPANNNPFAFKKD